MATLTCGFVRSTIANGYRGSHWLRPPSTEPKGPIENLKEESEIFIYLSSERGVEGRHNQL
jgi:hypothetical protein